MAMSGGGGYTVEVTGLSPRATEKDVHDFFAFSGSIDTVQIIRSGDCACTGYVTFRDAYSQETAVLLSGATILDQRVCITRWGDDEVDEYDFWKRASEHQDQSDTMSRDQSHGSDMGEAITMTQEVVKDMLAKGYVLGKDAMSKAKAFDESHQVSATAAAKVAELTERIGLADKLFAGMEAMKAVDDKYHVSETTRSALSATGRTAVAAATTVVNSSYFSRGALWVSGALDRAAKAAADMGTRGAEH